MKNTDQQNGKIIMNSLSKLLAFAICLQLTVGIYPVQNHMAYAQDDRSISTNESKANRGPASDNLNMDANEANDHSKNYIKLFNDQCVGSNGKIKGSTAFMHDKEIGSSEEPRMYNCSEAATIIQKIIIPGMNDISEEVKHSKINPNCPTCGIPNQDEDSVKNGQLVSGSCSAEEQKKFAKQDCSFGCNILYTIGSQDKSCPKSSGISGKCALEISKGVLKGIYDVLAFPFIMVKDAGVWTYNKIFGKSENETTEKSQVLSGLTDQDIKDGEKNPEKLKQTLLQRSAKFFNDLGKAIIGYPEYEEKSKCADCAAKADLMCGVIGNTSGFLITMFGNGAIFGATEGIAERIASKLVKVSKGTGKFASIASKTILVAEKTSLAATKVGKFVSKPFIRFGEVVASGASKVSVSSLKWWESFKSKKLYENLIKFKDSRSLKVVSNSIPGKITLSIGRGVSNSFEKAGVFVKKIGKVASNIQETTHDFGLGLTNSKLLRAQKINKLRSAKAAANATNEALRGVDELKVVKDASEGRTAEQWTDLKQKASNELQGLKVKHLDDVENAVPAEFEINAGKEKSILVETSKGTRELKIAKPADVESIHTYQDGKLAIVQHRDGSYIIHDMDAGSHLTQVPKGKEEFVDALLGKKTKNFDDLEGMSYTQVKTNLKINGTKFTEEVDATGAKTMKIETPNGCNPKSLSFGVDKAI